MEELGEGGVGVGAGFLGNGGDVVLVGGRYEARTLRLKEPGWWGEQGGGLRVGRDRCRNGGGPADVTRFNARMSRFCVGSEWSPRVVGEDTPGAVHTGGDVVGYHRRLTILREPRVEATPVEGVAHVAVDRYLRRRMRFNEV
mmetsp:Transcript_14057/g.28756  ORF Transcript_14057/g.28756 Transcript_14057/m.28756 type:complete len:142 (-) Transcript_14057:3514-3939(-)